MTVLHRLVARLDQRSGCWLWTGSVGSHGYGQISVKLNGARKQKLVHRIAFEAWVGPIPKGHQIDHLCRNKRCVRPDHLEAVTQRENILRSNAPSAIAVRENKCARGHDFTPENTHVTRAGARHCRACARLRWTEGDNPERRARAAARTREWLARRKRQAEGAA